MNQKDQSPQNIRVENQAQTLQKSSASFKSSLYTSKFDEHKSAEFEIKKLMNIVELQQHEINNWKRRYETAELRNQANNQTKTLIEYERHLDQLTAEIKQALQHNDDLSLRLRERDQLIMDQQKNEARILKRLQEVEEELQYQGKENDVQHYQKEKDFERQMLRMEETHIQQIAMMDEQVSNLQEELIRRNQAIDYLKSDVGKLERQLQDQKLTERQQIQRLDKEAEHTLSEMRQQLAHQSKLFNQEKSSLEAQIDKLGNQNQLLEREVRELKNFVEGLQKEIQLQVDQNVHLQEQLEDQKTYYQEQQEEIKQAFQEHLNELEIEVNKVTANMNQQAMQLEEYAKLNSSLEDTIDTLTKRNQELEEQLENAVIEYNQEVEAFNEESLKLQELLEEKGQEIDECRQQRGMLALKNNEFSIQLQRMQVDLEHHKQKISELQRQQEIQEQMREQIKKSQIEQVKRQLEADIEILESENRNLKYQFEMKSRECDEWKQQLKRA